MIQFNRNPAGRLSNFLFGFASIADGLVRVLSLGYLHSDVALRTARHNARRAIFNLKRKVAAEPVKEQ